jgi:hypothetical protein
MHIKVPQTTHKGVQTHTKQSMIISHAYSVMVGTAIAQWLRCCATNQVAGFFIDIKSFRSHYGPGVDSVSNRNGYQEYFLGVKVAGA